MTKDQAIDKLSDYFFNLINSKEFKHVSIMARELMMFIEIELSMTHHKIEKKETFDPVLCRTNIETKLVCGWSEPYDN